MSLSISLVPQHPNQEISVQLLSTLFGNNWWEFISGGAAPAGPGSIIAQLFQTIDVALLLYVSAIIIYTQLVGGMQTAHEGIPLGKRYHSVWSVIRGPAAWFLLFPLPWAKGMAMIQVILLTATYWGIGVADDVWSAFVKNVPTYSGTLIPYQGLKPKETRFVYDALVDTVAWTYLLQHEKGKYELTTQWVGSNSSGEQVWGLVPVNDNKPGGIQYQFGTLSVKCSAGMKAPGSSNFPNVGPASLLGNMEDDVFQAISGLPPASQNAQTNPVCTQQINAVSSALFPAMSSAANSSLTKIAVKIVNSNGQSNGSMPSSADLSTAVENFLQNEQQVFEKITTEQKSITKTDLKNFATEASKLGWASSSYYWWTLENINQQSQAQMTGVDAKAILPNAGAMANTVGAYYKPYIAAVEGYIFRYSRKAIGAPKSAQQAAENAAEIGLPSAGKATWAGKILAEVPPAFMSGDPLANVANFGRMLKQGGEDALGAAVASKVAGGMGATLLGGSGAGGSLLAGAAKISGAGLGAALAGGIAGGLKALGSIAMPVGFMLIIEGATLEYVFPSMPGIIMIIAIIGWLFLVLEMFVASVLWAAAHVYAEGEGFAPPQAQYGYAAVLGVLFRPLLLTMGFIFAFFIMDIGGWFVGGALEVFLDSMGGSQIGAIGLASMTAVIIIVDFLFIKTVLKLITHLADRAPQWIGGHSGQGLGESELGTSAVQAAGGGVNKYGMYAADKAGVAVDSIAAGMAASSADEEKKSRDRTAEAVNPGKAADTGKGTEEPEKKESPDK